MVIVNFCGVQICALLSYILYATRVLLCKDRYMAGRNRVVSREADNGHTRGKVLGPSNARGIRGGARSAYCSHSQKYNGIIV